MKLEHGFSGCRVFCGAVLLALMMTNWTASADQHLAKTDVWDIARGGQLYDKWYGVLGHQAPEQTHAEKRKAARPGGARNVMAGIIAVQQVLTARARITAASKDCVTWSAGIPTISTRSS